MQTVLLLQLLLLVVVANATPVLAKKLLGPATAWPLDGGMRLSDGQPFLGASKTVRGVVFSVVLTPLVAILVGLSWKVGLVVALSAMAGDLLSSFAKRRMGRPPSSQAIGLDQIPESLFPLLAARWLVPITVVEALVGTVLFFIGSLLASRILFKLNLRDRPY